MENQLIMFNKSSASSSACSNKVRTAYASYNSVLVVSDNYNKHGRSKSQMYLHKIINIILSGSSEKESKFLDNHDKKKGLGIDLNLRIGCFGNDDDNGFSSDCSGVIGGGDCINNGGSNVEFSSGSILVKGECDLKEVDFIEVEEEEERRVLSEVTDLETPVMEDVEMEEEVVVEKRVMGNNGEKGYMDLLVEASRLISGDFKEDETDEEEEKTKNRDEKLGTKRRKSKRINNECLMFDIYEDISPVVKSKRGRNQVLPFRYRDSILDPWKSTKPQRRSSQRVSDKSRH